MSEPFRTRTVRDLEDMERTAEQDRSFRDRTGYAEVRARGGDRLAPARSGGGLSPPSSERLGSRA